MPWSNTATVELADLYGALEELAKWHGLKMEDLKTMSHITSSAFEDGSRKSGPKKPTIDD
jgi:hypothetical protein